MTDPARLLLSIAATNILPIFLMAGVGFLLARFSGVEVTGLARATLYGFAPCLIFDLLVRSSLGVEDFGRMALLCVSQTAVMAAIGRGVAQALGLRRDTLIAFLLVVMISNGGNYGLPVVLLAFGQQALAFATVYFVTSSVLTYTVGISLAAGGRRTVKDTFRSVARVPAIYAVGAAVLVVMTGARVPGPVMTAVSLLSDATIPVMVLVLGMQIERAMRPSRPAVVAAATALSLLVAPLVAFALARLLGLSGPALQAGMIQASMPTAVVTTVLALEFEVDPAFVTSVVVITTLLSPLTLTVLIAWLQQVG